MTDIQGDRELMKRLNFLEKKAANRISLKAIRSGVTRIRTAIRREVPAGQGRDSKGRFTKSQKTEQLKKAIGLRVKMFRGEVIAKSGVAVGTSKQVENTTNSRGVKRWYLRLFGTGTDVRYSGRRVRQYKQTGTQGTRRGRKRGPGYHVKLTGNPVLHRGSIEGDAFVLRGFNSSKSAAVDAMSKTLAKELDKEVRTGQQ